MLYTVDLQLEGKSVLVTGGSLTIQRRPRCLGTDGMFGQMIEPEQVGDTLAFLASPRAGKLSGVVLNLGT